MSYWFRKPVVKHADHDQKDHGNWAGGGNGSATPDMTVGGALADANASGRHDGTRNPELTRSGHRPLYKIAGDISAIWRKQGSGVNYAAKPYLQALQSLDDINDNYGEDPARMVVAYFLSNARSFKGPEAKALKAELNAILKPSSRMRKAEEMLGEVQELLVKHGEGSHDEQSHGNWAGGNRFAEPGGANMRTDPPKPVATETPRQRHVSRGSVSTKETAQIVRTSLKESFPGVKFGIRGKKYSGGASVSVDWVDGPTTAQVDSIVGHMESSYFDSSIDYKGSRYHTLDGKPVYMGANYIHTSREYSDTALSDVIGKVKTDWFGSKDMPTENLVDAYKRGQLWRVVDQNFEHRVREALQTTSFVGAAKESAAAKRVRFEGDDGYGQGTVGMQKSEPRPEGEHKGMWARILDYLSPP